MRFAFPLAVLFSLPFSGCSSSDDGSTGGNPPGGGDDRRVALGKADSLSGSCKKNGVLACGGKSTGKCWCDTACVQYGDCCSDYQATCGGGEATECKSTADCATGEYCQAPSGCDAPGVCKPKPTDVVCTQVITQYCSCEGETKTSSNGCVFDRFAHKGECEPQPKSCGGFANLPCPSGEICVENPNDSCDPQNGGADCPGMCIAKKMCGGFAGLPCAADEDCVDDPTDSCDPQNGGADCSGVCVPKAGGCSPVMCELYCQYGFKKNEQGCEICACNEPPKNSCDGHCGGPSTDKSCWCDAACKKYGDCCGDYGSFCDTRTPASGACVKNSNDFCSTDADCMGGGCGGELCFNPAVSSGISTCECTAPTNVKGCGCVAGKCTWYN